MKATPSAHPKMSHLRFIEGASSHSNLLKLEKVNFGLVCSTRISSYLNLVVANPLVTVPPISSLFNHRKSSHC